MIWKISLLSTIGIICITILLALLINKSYGRKFVSPLTIMFIGVFAASVAMFIPIYFEEYKATFMSGIKVALMSLYSTIELFKVDDAFKQFWDAAENLEGVFCTIYQIVGTIVPILAPALTFGIVLSFLGNFLSYQKYLLHFFTDTFIFSELNEKSLSIAESIRKSNKKCMLVFTNVYGKNDKELEKLRENAAVLGGVCFKKNLNNINFKYHSSESKLHFMIIGEDEKENVTKTLKAVEQYREYSNVRIDVFAKQIESELLLKTAEKGKIKMIRRINEIQTLISRILYESGEEIFNHSIVQDDHKLIKVLVVGSGQYGIEMTKMLPWFCQMPGYRFEMDLVDSRTDITERLEMLCPDLLSVKYNGVNRGGEPNYTISIHEGIDVNASSFRKLLEQIGIPSYVFVCLGDDSQNVC